jgi:hypothetical protein
MTIKYEYDKSSMTAKVVGVDDCGTDVVIPATIEYYKKIYDVTRIGDAAFAGFKALRSIKIPSSIKYVGDDAFKDCISLSELCIEDGENTLEFGKCLHIFFYDCPLETLYLGRNISYPTGNSYPFNDKSTLKYVTIGNCVTSIAGNAFINCAHLNSIKVVPGNKKYDSRDNCNAIIETQTNTLIKGCNKTIIPDSVTIIGATAFRGCSGLTNIEIHDSVTSMEEGAFYKCSGLTNIVIPDSVISIGEFVFSGCSGLSSIKVDTDNTRYDSCGNCNAVIETKTNTLIVGCNKTVIPNRVTTIGSGAFFCCSGLKSVVIPDSVTSIGDSAFSGCSGLTNIEIPDSVTSIGHSAFWGCSGLKSVKINNKKERVKIGDGAFPSSTVVDYAGRWKLW